MTGKTQLRRAINKKFASKADKQILIPGLLGAYIGAVWMVSVPGRPSFVYVRVHGNNSEVIEAFNDTVSPILNLAVVLTRDELTPNYYRILRRDVAKYQDWYTPQIGYHASQHEFGGTGSMGQDIVWVQKQQFVPLEVRPMSTSGSSYQCFVDADYYQWNAGYNFFSGASTPDLASLRPAGNLQGLFLGVYMDGNTDSLAYITGTQFTHTPWPDNYRALIPTVPTSVGIPLAGILLTHEMTGINWTQIYDTRAILGNGGLTGSTGGGGGIPEAPIDGIIYGRQNAAWTAVTGTSGGGGTGSVSGIGTDHVLPRWSGSSTLVDSSVSDDGNVVEINRNVRVDGQANINPSADVVGVIVKKFATAQTSNLQEWRGVTGTSWLARIDPVAGGFESLDVGWFGNYGAWMRNFAEPQRITLSIFPWDEVNCDPGLFVAANGDIRLHGAELREGASDVYLSSAGAPTGSANVDRVRIPGGSDVVTISIYNANLAVSGTFSRGGVEIDPVGAVSGDILGYNGVRFVPTAAGGGGGGNLIRSVLGI